MYFMSSDHPDIVALAIVVTRGSRKGAMEKAIVAGTVVVNIARSTSFILAGMGSASDVDVDVMLRGGGGIVHCRFWLHPVSDEVHWCRLLDSAYDNAADPGKRRGLPLIQDCIVPVPHWIRLFMIIMFNML